MAGGVPISNSATGSAAAGVNPANISTPGNLHQNLCMKIISKSTKIYVLF